MKPTVMPYALFGYPTIEKSLLLIQRYIDLGARRIEIGFPFSDPLADGETLQVASQVALEQAITLQMLITAISPLKKDHPQVLFTLMSYLNPLMAKGLKDTLHHLSECFTSVVIPDLPLEAYEAVLPFFETIPLALVPLITPHTSENRIKAYCEVAKDFVYLVTINGVTGSGSGDAASLKPQVTLIKKYTTCPVIAGFGINTPQDVKEMAQIADHVIVASACLRHFDAGNFDLLDQLVRS